MAKNKSRTPAKGTAQAIRTKANKVKKYTKLIASKPNDPHVSKWQSKVK